VRHMQVASHNAHKFNQFTIGKTLHPISKPGAALVEPKKVQSANMAHTAPQETCLQSQQRADTKRARKPCASKRTVAIFKARQEGHSVCKEQYTALQRLRAHRAAPRRGPHGT